MGIFSKINSATDAEQFFIERDDVAALLKSERWVEGGSANIDQTEEKARMKELLQELSARPELRGKEIDVERLMHLSSDDIIDRFLRSTHGRIVAEDGEPEGDIVVEADIDDDDDMVSEELAEVYLAQGLKDMAKETYIKLSLLNPEKSVYFAGLIEKIDKNN